MFWPILYNKLLFKQGRDFLDIQYTTDDRKIMHILSMNFLNIKSKYDLTSIKNMLIFPGPLTYHHQSCNAKLYQPFSYMLFVVKNLAFSCQKTLKKNM